MVRDIGGAVISCGCYELVTDSRNIGKSDGGEGTSRRKPDFGAYATEKPISARPGRPAEAPFCDDCVATCAAGTTRLITAGEEALRPSRPDPERRVSPPSVQQSPSRACDNFAAKMHQD